MGNNIPALSYDHTNHSVVPLLASEQSLQTITAEPWLEISDEGLQLEGLCFNRNGDLTLCEVFGGTIFHVTLPDKKSLSF